MKAIHDPGGALNSGLAAIRVQFDLPGDFPPAVLAAAQQAAAAPLGYRVDRTDIPFVTLDPASSRDLDQAFAIEQSGDDLILRYAIADVGHFVPRGGLIDAEAWGRGETFYLPDGRIPLYPPALSEGAASLLPNADKPAILLSVRVAGDGDVQFEGAERVLMKSRAKLGYATVKDAELPPLLFDFSSRIAAAETRRGAERIDPPQQIVEQRSGGGYALGFRPMSRTEQANAALSLAANLAVADLLQRHQTGLFRIMRAPGQRAVSRLRQSAAALGLTWSSADKLATFQQALDPNRAADAAFMLAVRRAGEGARYVPYDPDETPWHAAMAATYTHCTAPLRRLGDRFVLEAALLLTEGKPIPDQLKQDFAALPQVMNRAGARSAQVDAAVLDLAEAVALEGRVGEIFSGRVIDEDDRGAKVQLCDLAVIARIDGDHVALGDPVNLKLVEDNPGERRTRFALA